jgi:hypothetical protein
MVRGLLWFWAMVQEVTLHRIPPEQVSHHRPADALVLASHPQQQRCVTGV